MNLDSRGCPGSGLQTAANYLICICCRGVGQPERCLGDAAHTGDDEWRLELPLLHERLQRSQQFLTRTEPDRMDLQRRSSSC